jgi:serine/threonine protein kinase
MSEPSTIGPFRVIRPIGIGGMGEVFLAERNGELVAVKCIHPSLASDPEFRNRFRREVAVSSRVRSSTCAAYIDSDIATSSPWLATEYVPGLDLQQYVSTNGPLPEQEAITLAVGLAEALRQIHAAGIVHRDLKPSNVILSPTGPKVIDFGIARASEQTAFTRTGSSLGSPGWMAPEQIRGQEISQSTDMFSWGALIAFASSGSPPFGNGPPESLMYKVLEEDPELSRVPDSLRNLCWRALSKDPVGRPSPDGALVELLGPTQSVRTEAAVTQRINTNWISGSLVSTTTGAAPSKSKASRRKLIVPAAFAFVAVLLLAGVTIAVRQPKPNPTSTREAQAASAEASETSVTTQTTQKVPVTTVSKCTSSYLNEAMLSSGLASRSFLEDMVIDGETVQFDKTKSWVVFTALSRPDAVQKTENVDLIFECMNGTWKFRESLHGGLRCRSFFEPDVADRIVEFGKYLGDSSTSENC